MRMEQHGGLPPQAPGPSTTGGAGRAQSAPVAATAAASALRTLAEASLPLPDGATLRSLSEQDIAKVLQLTARTTPAALEEAIHVPAVSKDIEEWKDVPKNIIGADEISVRDLQTVRWTTQAKLTEAEAALSRPHADRLADWDARPSDLLRLAQDFYDAGGYDNLVRSGLLSQSLLLDLQPRAQITAPSLSSWLKPQQNQGEGGTTSAGSRLRRLLPSRVGRWPFFVLALICAVITYWLLR